MPVWLLLPAMGSESPPRAPILRLMMLDLDFDAAAVTDVETRVLCAYSDAEGEIAAARPAKADDESTVPQAAIWVPRIREVEGVPGDQLAPVHGRLIALGLLNFQLQGRDEGVLYRVTPEGRRAVERGVAVDVDEMPLRKSA